MSKLKKRFLSGVDKHKIPLMGEVEPQNAKEQAQYLAVRIKNSMDRDKESRSNRA